MLIRSHGFPQFRSHSPIDLDRRIASMAELRIARSFVFPVPFSTDTIACTMSHRLNFEVTLLLLMTATKATIDRATSSYLPNEDTAEWRSDDEGQKLVGEGSDDSHDLWASTYHHLSVVSRKICARTSRRTGRWSL